MCHLLKFDELCLKLRAAGDSMDDDEQLVLLLGSLSSEYDDMVRIIEAHSNVTLLDAKEMLRREYDTPFGRETRNKSISRRMIIAKHLDAFTRIDDTLDK